MDIEDGSREPTSDWPTVKNFSSEYVVYSRRRFLQPAKIFTAAVKHPKGARSRHPTFQLTSETTRKIQEKKIALLIRPGTGNKAISLYCFFNTDRIGF